MKLYLIKRKSMFPTKNGQKYKHFNNKQNLPEALQTLKVDITSIGVGKSEVYLAASLVWYGCLYLFRLNKIVFLRAPTGYV